MPLVALRIVDAIRCRAAFGIGGEVVIVDFFPRLTPCLAGVLELTHEFLFLRVHADPRVAAAAEFLALRGDVLELLIALGMRLSGVQHFAVAAQAILPVAQ